MLAVLTSWEVSPDRQAMDLGKLRENDLPPLQLPPSLR